MELFTFARSARPIAAYIEPCWSTQHALDDRESSLAPLSFATRVCVCYTTVGGAQERVEIHLIAHSDDNQTEARRRLTEQFATFNAGKAQCFLASDREHLLAVIEAGFGNFYDFNRVTRSLLTSRLHDALSSRSRGSR